MLHDKLLTIDDREQKPIFDLFEHHKIPHVKSRIKIGDAVFGDLLCVERKTSNDFASSLMDGRLSRQIKNMKEFKHKVVIIVGHITDVHSRIHPHALLGKLSSLIVFSGVQICVVKDNNEYVYLVGRILDKLNAL